ncbi:zinc-dependent alcohol dehydrogenase [Endozoicomonas arenosclerae]|uniref:zinc-dependent alcohol dehydrogenase n=1 Tax=Endozoicomonas arenosclerae TaxID=1633495 RepID=UPI000782BFFC|nr:zinc-binding dehydrogenase [Endozoicomonas arenosclerae]
MRQMPQVRIHGQNKVQLDWIDRPVAGPDDVIVQVEQCGICGSDLGYIARGGLGADSPMPLGHELAGTVLEAGDKVRHVRVGDRVTVNPEANGNGIGNYGPEGGFAPLLKVRGASEDEQAVMPLPEGMSFETGALIEPLSVAMHAVHQGQAKAQDRAVIFGAGPIGLGILQVLSYYGLKEVVVVDRSRYRLGVAESLGAVPFQADSGDLSAFLQERHGVTKLMGMPVPDSDLYFEATGAGAVFQQAVSLSKRGGRLVVVGVHKEPVQLDLVNVLIRELTITASMAYPDEFPRVIEMLESGKVHPQSMISHRFALQDFDEALDTARDPESAIKVMVNCQS